MMRLETFYFLLTPTGRQWLAETAVSPLTPHNHLQIAAHLRQQLPPEVAQAVLETVLLRQEATTKFSRASQMFFTRPALEQASAEIISTYRARRFVALGVQRVADLGCGVGGDALALAAQAEVIGVDLDEVRLEMAQENVRVYGSGENFRPLQADITTMPVLSVEALFFDPARRDENGRRLFSVQQYRPPLSAIERWHKQVSAVAVKISPGVDYAELPTEAEVEFISVQGEVREGVLWYGALRSGAGRRATLLPGGHSLTNEKTAEIPLSAPQTYLYEPDGAVIRAHLVEQLAARLNASKIDQEIAYLTADDAQPTPFARCFALEAAMPFQLKQLRHYLRQHNIGRVTIKKRGSPLEPDTLQKQLRLRGPQHRILFLTQVKGEATVLIGQEVKT